MAKRKPITTTSTTTRTSKKPTAARRTSKKSGVKQRGRHQKRPSTRTRQIPPTAVRLHEMFNSFVRQVSQSVTKISQTAVSNAQHNTQQLVHSQQRLLNQSVARLNALDHSIKTAVTNVVARLNTPVAPSKPKKKVVKKGHITIKKGQKSGVIFSQHFLNRWQWQWKNWPDLNEFGKKWKKIQRHQQRKVKSTRLSVRRWLQTQRRQLRQELHSIFTLPAWHATPASAPVEKIVTSEPTQSLSRWQRLTRPFVTVVSRYPWQTGLSLTFTVIILASAFGIYVYIFKDLPSPLELTQHEPVVTTKILDRNGQVLFRIYKDENRSVIPLSKVPTHMVQATIAIEDKNFYHHFGFDPKGIVRAFVANTKGQSVQGGSTLTQQLVKNRLLSPEKTLQRKIREVILSVLVDGTYTKDEILEMYFNEIAYGGSTYGIEEAAHRYFDKSAHDLTLAESALLAGLPAAPSVYSPFGSYPELAYARQEEVLRRMVEDGYITLEQAEAAKKEVLVFRPNTVDISAPHFVMYVKKMLAEQYGEEELQEGGLVIRTTLDLELQRQTQKLVTDELDKLARLRINNGAALVTNPQTGEVLAMVGSKNYFDFEHDGQVNVTLRPRQPGSSIKPLTYAVAMEMGKHPSSVEDDAPITYKIPGSPSYSPKNYDGKFHGKVTLREALGSSYNIPAVKLLAWAGINRVIDKGQEMGITTWQDRRRFGLSLTLGGGEVLMIDMAKVYGTFANQGYTVDINPILEVSNYKGEQLYRNTCALDHVGCPKRKTLDTKVAYQITDVLKDNVARTPAFGPRSVLTIPGQEVAVKTGTTNNLRDNWTFGYTTDRLVGVWVGNNDNTPMSYVASGITGASPIWNNIIRLMLDDKNPHRFSGPEGMIKVQICARTGTLTCKGCPVVREEYFTPGTEPKVACNPAQFVPKPKPQPTGDPNRDKILDGLKIE